MASLSSLLGPFKKLGGIGEQLFVWNVVGEVVSGLMQPFVRAEVQKVNEADPNDVLSPAQVADAAVRHHLRNINPLSEVHKSGLNAERYQLLVDNAGEAPGPGQLAEMERRGIIGASGDGPESTSFQQGMRETRLADKWTDPLLKLDKQIPSPIEIANAVVRAQMGNLNPQEEFQKAGGDPEYYQFFVDNVGDGPSPLEAAALAHRGIIPWQGTGPNVVSFEQAVRESRARNKWTDAYRKASDYRPPPRTITAMFREGSIDEQRATQLLSNYGVLPEDVPAYLTKPQHTLVQRAHEVTESELMRLYVQHALSKEQVTALLKAHNYTEGDIPYILQAAEIQAHNTEVNAAVTIIKQLFLHGQMEYNEAVTQLDSFGVLADHRDYLLKLWGVERAHGTRPLSVTQIQQAAGAGIWTEDQAVARLVAEGYPEDDARVLIETKIGTPEQRQQAQAAADAALHPAVQGTPPNPLTPTT